MRLFHPPPHSQPARAKVAGNATRARILEELDTLTWYNIPHYLLENSSLCEIFSRLKEINYHETPEKWKNAERIM